MKNTCFRQFLGCYLLLLLTHVISFTSKHRKLNIMSSKTIKNREIECLYGYIQNILSHYALSSTYSMLVWNKIEIFRYASAFSTPH